MKHRTRREVVGRVRGVLFYYALGFVREIIRCVAGCVGPVLPIDLFLLSVLRVLNPTFLTAYYSPAPEGGYHLLFSCELVILSFPYPVLFFLPALGCLPTYIGRRNALVFSGFA